MFCSDAIRLAGGEHAPKGTVEVRVRNQWNLLLVCNGWTLQEGQVVCNHLGFSGARYVNKTLRNDRGSLTVYHLRCSGNENRLGDCSFNREDTNCMEAFSVAATCMESMLLDV